MLLTTIGAAMSAACREVGYEGRPLKHEPTRSSVRKAGLIEQPIGWP
jgi:hypothetical protein